MVGCTVRVAVGLRHTLHTLVTLVYLPRLRLVNARYARSGHTARTRLVYALPATRLVLPTHLHRAARTYCHAAVIRFTVWFTRYHLLVIHGSCPLPVWLLQFCGSPHGSTLGLPRTRHTFTTLGSYRIGFRHVGLHIRLPYYACPPYRAVPGSTVSSTRVHLCGSCILPRVTPHGSCRSHLYLHITFWLNTTRMPVGSLFLRIRLPHRGYVWFAPSGSRAPHTFAPTRGYRLYWVGLRFCCCRSLRFLRTRTAGSRHVPLPRFTRVYLSLRHTCRSTHTHTPAVLYVYLYVYCGYAVTRSCTFAVIPRLFCRTAHVPVHHAHGLPVPVGLRLPHGYCTALRTVIRTVTVTGWLRTVAAFLAGLPAVTLRTRFCGLPRACLPHTLPRCRLPAVLVLPRSQFVYWFTALLPADLPGCRFLPVDFTTLRFPACSFRLRSHTLPVVHVWFTFLPVAVRFFGLRAFVRFAHVAPTVYTYGCHAFAVWLQFRISCQFYQFSLLVQVATLLRLLPFLLSSCWLRFCTPLHHTALFALPVAAAFTLPTHVAVLGCTPAHCTAVCILRFMVGYWFTFLYYCGYFGYRLPFTAVAVYFTVTVTQFTCLHFTGCCYGLVVRVCRVCVWFCAFCCAFTRTFFICVYLHTRVTHTPRFWLDCGWFAAHCYTVTLPPTPAHIPPAWFVHSSFTRFCIRTFVTFWFTTL